MGQFFTKPQSIEATPVTQDDTVQCSAIKDNGQQCKNRSKKGEYPQDYCKWHQTTKYNNLPSCKSKKCINTLIDKDGYCSACLILQSQPRCHGVTKKGLPCTQLTETYAEMLKKIDHNYCHWHQDQAPRKN